jgi:hypothetical protein
MSPIERIARASLWVAAGALGIFGLVSFVVPDTAAGQFPWRVGPFLAMTIGGWAIGMALMAVATARTWQLPRVIAALVTLWAFGIGELVVLLLFLDRFVGSLLAVPYLVGLIALAVSAATGLAWIVAERPQLREADPPPAAFRIGAAVFVILVGALALATGIASQGGAATEGRVFPEAMTLFSARAFTAFFTSLALGAVALLVMRASLAAYRFYAGVGLLLIAPITLAALLNLVRFDFVAQPGHGVYLGAYLVVGAGAIAVLLMTRNEREAPASPAT